MSFPLRIVGDHDVDRLAVQVWQHIQPTGTNHPTGLIPVFEFNMFDQGRERRERVTGQGKEDLRVDARERAFG